MRNVQSVTLCQPYGLTSSLGPFAAFDSNNVAHPKAQSLTPFSRP